MLTSDLEELLSSSVFGPCPDISLVHLATAFARRHVCGLKYSFQMRLEIT